MAGIPVYTASPINSNASAFPSNRNWTWGSTTDLNSREKVDGTYKMPPTPFASQTAPFSPSARSMQEYEFGPPQSSPNRISHTRFNSPNRKTKWPSYAEMPGLRRNSTQPLSTNRTQSVSQDLSHPPGYQQEQSSFDNRQIEEPVTPPVFGSPKKYRGGLLDHHPDYDITGEGTPFWDAARDWAKAAGKKLSVTEAHVWKMVNGRDWGNGRSGEE